MHTPLSLPLTWLPGGSWRLGQMPDAETTPTPKPPHSFLPLEPRLAPRNMLPFPVVPWQGASSALWKLRCNSGTLGPRVRVTEQGKAWQGRGDCSPESPWRPESPRPQTSVPYRSGTTRQQLWSGTWDPWTNFARITCGRYLSEEPVYEPRLPLFRDLWGFFLLGRSWGES